MMHASSLVGPALHVHFSDLMCGRKNEHGQLAMLLSAVALCVAIGPGHADTISGRARVIDGDTLSINGTHIRLAGIDAPEHDQPKGDAATRQLWIFTGGDKISCTPIELDRYHRIVATCRTPETPDLGEAMVRSGYAIRYPKYDPQCRYCAAEAEAKRERRGLWTGIFEKPWVWRHGAHDHAQ